MPGRSASKTYGTVSADEQKEMSGLEFVQGLVDGSLPLNTIAKTLGYDITEAESGRVVITARPSDIHLNPWGTVHGGLSATLLDSCMGLAIQSTLEKGTGSTTLEFKISLVRPIMPDTGPIKAEGVVLNCGRRVGTAEPTVTLANLCDLALVHRREVAASPVALPTTRPPWPESRETAPHQGASALHDSCTGYRSVCRQQPCAPAGQL